MQVECLVDGTQCGLRLIAADQHGDLDLTGGDHLNVDAGIGNRAEHFLSHACLPGHPQADHRNLGDLVIMRIAGRAYLGRSFRMASSAAASSSVGTVNEISARSSCPMFCTIMSTVILPSASRLKIS